MYSGGKYYTVEFSKREMGVELNQGLKASTTANFS